MECPCCFTDYLMQCIDNIIVHAGVENGSYQIRITDKFGAHYEVTQTADNGSFSLPITSFPDGMFMNFSGSFRLQVLQNNVIKPLLISDGVEIKQYDCIDFEVRAGSFDKNYLGWQQA